MNKFSITYLIAIFFLSGCQSTTPKFGNHFTLSGPKKDFIYVKPGPYVMGSNDNYSKKHETPLHSVSLNNGFWISKYEITRADYVAVTGEDPSTIREGGMNIPVNNVNWDDAMAYCKKLTDIEREAGRLPKGYVYRLPTEAEWEYAARGGNKSLGFNYSGSNDINEVGWYLENITQEGIQCVGQKKANELGIHDMTGNVSELCLDSYDKEYYKHSPKTNPVNLDNSISNRVVRGGCWKYVKQKCTIIYRDFMPSSLRCHQVGFRVVLGCNQKTEGEHPVPDEGK